MTRGGLDPNAWCPAVLLCRRCRVIAVHRRIARAGCIKWPLGRHRCIRFENRCLPVVSGTGPTDWPTFVQLPETQDRAVYLWTRKTICSWISQHTIAAITGSHILDVVLPAVSQQEFKAANGFLPTTFLERGVTVPFTTPMLIGARARPGKRAPLELMPNVGRACAEFYILPLGNISGLRKPTVARQAPCRNNCDAARGHARGDPAHGL